MTYTVITAFVDLQDDNRLYRVGETYPRSGKTVSTDRINSLISADNALGVSLIVENENRAEKAEKTAETKAETKAPRTRRAKK